MNTKLVKTTIQFIVLVLLQLTVKAADLNNLQNYQEWKIDKLKNIPENDVNCIFRDQKGFMWIGTLDGLHRYDGYSYKTYRITSDENSISSNMIIAIDEDSKGNLWIGTYGKGICKLDPKTEKFVSYGTSSLHDKKHTITNDITCLVIDANDNLWIGNWFGTTRIQFDNEMDEIIHQNSFPLSPTTQQNDVKTLFQDKDNNIWIGTNIYTQRIINPNDQNLKFDTYDVSCESICSYENGIITTGLTTNLFQKNKASNRYDISKISSSPGNQIYYVKPFLLIGGRDGIKCLEKTSKNNWTTTQHFYKNLSDKSIGSNIITTIATDAHWSIWVGSRGGGVDLISINPDNFKCYKHTKEEGSLADNLTRALFEDSNQNLWVGTEEKGVSVLAKDANIETDFKHLLVNNFKNENRVYAINESFTPESKEQKSLVWLGTSYPTCLAAYDPVTLKKKDLKDKPKEIGFVFCIEVINDSTMWVGTYGQGLYRIHLDYNGSIKDIEKFTPKSNSKLLSYIIRSLYEDRDGNLWIGTDKGINCITREEIQSKNPKIQVYTLGKGSHHLSHDYILQISQSRNGTIWIGTMGGGLISYKKNKISGDFSFTSITTSDGLENNTIKSIVEDDLGYLWLSSNDGLARYNPANGNILSYDIQDGLHGLEFSEICGIKQKNGKIIMGGIHGINVFNPIGMQKDDIVPQIFFTDFYIQNKIVEVGDKIKGRVILNKSLEYTKEIELDYGQNSFSVGFVGLHYNAPQKNNYLYYLEGFDEQWTKSSPQHRIAKYTNIPSGEYTFKVMGSNCDNAWCEEPITLKITVKPPLFLYPIAITIYCILFIIIAIILFRVYKSFSLRKKDLLIATLEKKKIEEVSAHKLRFFTNISHEFRTPLTLINLPLEELISKGESMTKSQRDFHQNLIKQNVGLMLRLVNQLMDFRKFDQDNLSIEVREQDIIEFLQEIYQVFQPLANQKEIEFNFVSSVNDTTLFFDQIKLEKVIYNLLANAFKFSNVNGQIILKIEENLDKEEYCISVSDTGIGIDSEDRTHVFERYYQSKKNHGQNLGGTGIGLALSKGVIDLHKGEIWCDNNKEGKGTTFFITLKKGDKHFSKDNIIKGVNTKKQTQQQVEENPTLQLESQYISNNHKRAKLLIVEDNYELRSFIKNIFISEYQVLEASDGVQGFHICSESLPDIIISDVMMPNMDGIEMCKKIKQEELTSHIPVLLLTAKNTTETQVGGYDMGADSYMSKPFQTEVLLASVRSLIRNREKLRNRFQKEIQINPAIISNTPADARFMDRILALIEENISDSDFTVEKLAESYGVSRIYLNRKIKALTGETSNQFIRNIRLKHAAELLKQNVLSVSEVTWQVGYNDLRTFRTRFKEKFGVSPSEYAKREAMHITDTTQNE